MEKKYTTEEIIEYIKLLEKGNYFIIENHDGGKQCVTNCEAVNFLIERYNELTTIERALESFGRKLGAVIPAAIISALATILIGITVLLMR